MPHRFCVFLWAGALWLGSTVSVWAQDPVTAQDQDQAPEQIQLRDPIHKMGRGVVSVLTSWLELPKQVHLGTQQGNPLIGAGQGLAHGMKLTVLRLGVGIYEAVTFPLPYPKDFASPYEQMELPDYAWE